MVDNVGAYVRCHECDGASGKSMVLATTRGNATIDTPEAPVSVGLNIYRKR